MILIEQLSVYTIMFLISGYKKIRHTSSSWSALRIIFTIDQANQWELKHWYIMYTVVCPHVYSRNYMSVVNSPKSLCIFLWLWPNPFLVALDYVVYFWFCERHHVFI